MNRAQIKSLIGATLYHRALRYYERGRVHHYESVTNAPNDVLLTAQVDGSEEYNVSIWMSAEGTYRNASCDCPFNHRGDGPICKHIGAVLLQYIDHASLSNAPSLQEILEKKGVVHGNDLRTVKEESVPTRATTDSAVQTQIVGYTVASRGSGAYHSNINSLFGRNWREPMPESDSNAVNLLRCYSNQAVQEELRTNGANGNIHKQVELVAEWHLDGIHRNVPPEVRLRIGMGGHRYIVKSIPQFVDAIEQGREVCYGKKLTLVHHLDAFDPTALPLIQLMRRQVGLMRYAEGMAKHSSYGGSSLRTSAGGALAVAEPICDEMFALGYHEDGYGGTTTLGGYHLVKQMPTLTLETEPRKGGVNLSISPHLNWYHGESWVYLFDSDTIWQVSKADFDAVSPVLEHLGRRAIFFTAQDAATFCSYVLPEIRQHVRIVDENRLLLDQIPLIPIVQYYLDAPHHDAITVYPVFLYGEDMVSPIAPITGEFLRDKRTETRTKALLAAYFTAVASPTNSCLYEVREEEAIYRFLEEGVPALLASGEVYMTDAFRSLEAPTPTISVGISVSTTLLDLNIDSGEFPPEELRDLLATLHKKKRYHRLRDGRLLKMEASMEVLEELDETLRLSGAELAEGHISMPLYRAPSLDKALAGQEGIQFHRDDAFRRISRSFHNVADSAYALPDSLKKVLRKYQRTGYRWLRTLDGYGMGGILADDMGLGKTLQVLSYLLALKEEGITQGEQSIIVCPASLVLNWAEECAKFTPTLRVLVVDGTSTQRLALTATLRDYDLIVTSYDLLRRDIAVYQDHMFHACIIDEAQAIKNHTTQKCKAVCKVKSQVRFALTGTPIENRLSELWSIFSFLMPGYLYAYAVFRETFERPIVQEQDNSAVHRLNQLTSPFILRRMKKEVLKELPPKIEHLQHVVFEPEQKKLYQAAVMDARTRLRALKPEDRIQVFAVLSMLRQICCDPRLHLDNWQGGSAKLEACAELVSSAVDGGHRILLFSQFTSMLSFISARLTEMGVSHFTLQGSTPKPVRAELVHRFNDGKVSVFLISLKAGGTGLNLTAADIVIHYDPWWNVAAQNQATDRAYRIGQRNTVQVYQLIAQDTIEEKIVEMQQAKQDLANTITGSEGAIMSMKPEELLALLEEQLTIEN